MPRQLLEVPLMNQCAFSTKVQQESLHMKIIKCKRIIYTTLIGLLGLIWINTPAVAKRYYAYNDHYSNFSLFNAGNLWEVICRDFKLKHDVDRPSIRKELRWISKNQRDLERTSTRAAPYLYYIYDQVKKRNLPSEIALLPIIESEYDPFSKSNKGAAGIWQFMPGTGRLYGLKSGHSYDGRRDIIESTRAALDYLTYLRDEFKGDWLLAFAAYNSGEGTVRAAIQHNRRLGKRTDFWSLPLPQQTKQYVPRLIALAKVIKQPDNYSFQLSPIRNAPYFAQIDVNPSLKLTDAAEYAGVEFELLRALNPAYKGKGDAANSSTRLLLPIKSINQFNDNIRAKDGGLIATNAERFPKADVDTDRFGQKNEINDDGFVAQLKGVMKSITTTDANESEQTENAASEQSEVATEPAAKITVEQVSNSSKKAVAVKRVQHTIHRGDTLYSISKQYRVEVKQLSNWNHISSRTKLKPGEHLSMWVRS